LAGDELATKAASYARPTIKSVMVGQGCDLVKGIF